MTGQFEFGIVLIHILCVTITLFVLLLRPRLVPLLLVLVMPFGNFELFSPVTMSFAKEITILFLLALPFRLAVDRSLDSRLRLPSWLVAFLVLAVLSTLYNYVFLPERQDLGFELSRTPGLRPLIQLGSLFLRAAIFWILFISVTSLHSAARVLKCALVSSTIVASYGIYQFVGYYVGWPIMGMSGPDIESSGQHAVILLAGEQIYRVGSLVGEPKFCAAFLLPSMVIIICVKIFRAYQLRGWVTSYPILVLHLLCFVLTLSTAGYYATVIALPVLLLVWSRYAKKRYTLPVVGVLLVSTFSLAFLLRYVPADIAEEVFRARFTGRIGEVQSPEAATLDFLADNPVKLLTGIGLGNISFETRSYFPNMYQRPVTVSLDANYLQILAEGGILSLVVFLGFLGSTLLAGGKAIRQSPPSEYTSLAAITLSVATVSAIQDLFFNTDRSGQLWLYFGLVVTLTRMAPLAARTVLLPRSISRRTLQMEPASTSRS